MDKQEKPLRDWTLGEVQKICESHDERCRGCPFTTDARCRISGGTPNLWDLTDQPCFSEAEVAVLHLLRAAGAETLGRADDGLLTWHGGLTQGLLPHRLFPSIRAGQSVVLGEIVGE